MKYYTAKALGCVLGIGADEVTELRRRGVIREGLAKNGLFTLEESAREIIAALKQEDGRDKREGRMQLLYIIQRLRKAFLQAGIVGGCFELRWPLEYLIYPDDAESYFDGFVSSIAKQIGAALELPHELLMKQFTASYSASRAALLEAWKSFSQWRDWMVEKFCQPIYEEWLAEAVARGRVAAPGFFADPMLRKTYCAAQWYGPTQGQLDRVKEVEAANCRVRYGFSTRAREAMELTGTDFWDNIRTAKRENELMRDAGLDSTPIQEKEGSGHED